MQGTPRARCFYFWPWLSGKGTRGRKARFYRELSRPDTTRETRKLEIPNLLHLVGFKVR
jgi:hypothetical protein